MSGKLIQFDFNLPESLYRMNQDGQPIAVLCALTGYSAEFVTKMIQREMCRKSREPKTLIYEVKRQPEKND